ncbi:flagellar basal-body rod protein FlgF [Chelativorans sp. M5D2P16]|uniref:flagellar basal-body rod protein FlgF n=1 Tax=Chelativorans sp. M5D2P16 TaxID=3095678 RepID=UPI002AC9FE33|nr:flagellar basal-body rod protein FlgF [Chelativorans sp. M5D2P16]MDZ5698437.1 flagellar basal-body rod protein FlgF [Chelativorans sp. M5D2P16]
MQTGLYVSLSSQMALEKRLATIADNVANSGTTGFRAGGVTFDDVMNGLTDKSVSFVSAGDDFYDTRAGALQETGSPFDFAVQGDAWFAVETPAGPMMSRDGRFTMLDTGELVTLEGHPVLDAGGAPLLLDPQAGPPEAGADGTLRQNGQLLGAIGLFAFTPGPGAVRYGNSGFLPDQQPQPVVDRPDVGVAQGFLEGSNVNPVKEMMRLIEVQRTFEQVTALARDGDTAMKDAIKTLGS